MKRKRQKVPKQRNPFVAAAIFRVAGAHDKSNKAKRAEDKRFAKTFKRLWGSVDPDADLGLDR